MIFEDDANALTSKLFRAAYSDTSNFVYANGGSNIEAIIQGTVDKATNDWLPGIWDKDPNEMVYVYLDMIPANKSVKQTYIKLRSLARKNLGKMIVFPIVCSEYYMIKAFGDQSNPNILTCIQRGDYFNTSAYKSDPRGCRNFEKFCKYLLKDEVMDCMSTDSRKSAYTKFYTTDCLCGMHKHDCREATLVRKSIKLLSAYECVPSGSMATNKSPFNYDKLMDIHRQLVQDFNDFSDRLKSLDTRVNAGTYKHIMPID